MVIIVLFCADVHFWWNALIFGLAAMGVNGCSVLTRILAGSSKILPDTSSMCIFRCSSRAFGVAAMYGFCVAVLVLSGSVTCSTCIFRGNFRTFILNFLCAGSCLVVYVRCFCGAGVFSLVFFARFFSLSFMLASFGRCLIIMMIRNQK